MGLLRSARPGGGAGRAARLDGPSTGSRAPVAAGAAAYYHGPVNSPWLSAAAGAASLVGLMWAEVRGERLARAALKTAASLGFIALALSLGVGGAYGRLVLAGLVLSLIGDLSLLSKERKAFVAGLAAFLGAHLAYASAFAGRSHPSAGLLLALCAAAVLVLRWLWPHLGSLRLPVTAYTAVITAMLWLALGFPRREVAAGALLFYLSDLFVARGAFVAPGKENQLLGWPLYYAGQYLIAASLG